MLNFAPARSTILRKKPPDEHKFEEKNAKRKHPFQSKASGRAQKLHKKNPLKTISVWDRFFGAPPYLATILVF